MLADSMAISKGESEAGKILSQIESEFRLLYGSFTGSAAGSVENDVTDK
jgi:hypothetical protein